MIKEMFGSDIFEYFVVVVSKWVRDPTTLKRKKHIKLTEPTFIKNIREQMTENGIMTKA